MSKTSDKIALVVDTGYYLSLATQLIPSYKKVLYHCVPADNGFADPNMSFIGQGIDGLELAHDMWDVIDDVDIVIFPDSHYMGMQSYLRKMGKVVFGTAKGAELEHYRWSTRQLLESLDLPTVPAERILGTEALREYLFDKEDKWIKISTYRGLMETFHHINYKLSDGFITELEYKLGPLKNMFYFIVEDSMPGIEFGQDTFVIDGKFPKIQHFGVEIKDAGYIGRCSEDMPDILSDSTLKLSPFFSKVQMRGSYSNEIRINKKGIGFLIDPTPRIPSPPGFTIMNNIENYGEVIWDIANGIVPELKVKNQFVAEIILYSDEAKAEWLGILVPEEIEQYVKFRYAMKADGTWYSVPNMYKQDVIGSVVASADSVEEAIKLVTERADMIKADGLHFNSDSMNKATEEIAKGSEYGIEFK